MHNVPPRRFPAIGDGHDNDTTVTRAWLSLIMFGGSEHLDNISAASLLTRWKHYPTLSPEQVAAVVARFPRPRLAVLPPGVLGQPIGGQVRPRSFGGRS